MTQGLIETRFGPEPIAAAMEAVPCIKVASPRGHRRKFGKDHRVMMGGATVDVSTAATVAKWRSSGLSLGLLHDQVYAFAKKRGFKPARNKKSK